MVVVVVSDALSKAALFGADAAAPRVHVEVSWCVTDLSVTSVHTQETRWSCKTHHTRSVGSVFKVFRGLNLVLVYEIKLSLAFRCYF